MGQFSQYIHVHEAKERLIEELQQEGCHNLEVLAAIRKVPREEFIEKKYQGQAYSNKPLSIECNQTISQPYIVARMTELLLSHGKLSKVLEIGTGSGYQAAILANLVEEVYTIERFEKLYLSAKQRLKDYANIHCFYGDGNNGLKEHAPFDGIIITAAVSSFPVDLTKQLADNGIAVYPEVLSNWQQQLVVIRKHGDTLRKATHESVRFVPMLAGIA